MVKFKKDEGFQDPGVLGSSENHLNDKRVISDMLVVPLTIWILESWDP
jgi:hypothetical protein